MRNNRPIQVVMLGTAPYGQGGVSSVVTQFANHNWGGEIELTRIDTHVTGSVMKRIGVFLVGYCKLLCRLLFKPRSVDLVHMHMSCDGSFQRKYLLHRMLKRFGKKDVIQLHAGRFETFYRSASVKKQQTIRRLLRECDRLLVLGSYWKEVILQIEPEARMEVVQNSVQLPEKCAAWQKDSFRLIYLGALIKPKGIPDLLQAMEILVDRNPEMAARLRLTVAGSGEAEADLHRLAETLQLNGYVEFTGWIDGDEKQELLRSGQCLVLPSYHEGLPVSILEALSYGLPVVSTDVGSIADAVIDAENGYLVPVRAPERIADAISNVFSSQEHWKTLSQNARRSAETRFNERVMFSNLEKVYQILMNERGE